MQTTSSTTAFRVCAFAYKFTGKERDTESGLDYFGARYYASSMGRFMSPDWSEDPDTIPYGDLSDPQTFNLYGYVTNNPLRRVDPTGHDGFPVLDAIEATSMAAVDAGIGYLATGATWTVSTLAAPAVAVGGMLFYTKSLGDPAEDRFIRMQAQRGKQRLDQSSGEFDHLDNRQLADEYAKETNPARRERIKEEQKNRGARRSRQSSGKKAPAPPVKNDPASQRARQNANPVPAPVITPAPPAPPPSPKDKHGEPS